MARTTINIDPEILGQLKARARRERKSFGRLASELLATSLHETGRTQPEGQFDWTSSAMHARIDIEDKEAVRRILDRR